MRLLDLYCGAGGAAMGYFQAGFTEIIGIDVVHQAHYPFDFLEADALDLPFDLSDFDLVHASPPCQAHSPLGRDRHGWGVDSAKWPDLIGPTRDILLEAAVPYVIENVQGAKRLMESPVELTGEMFGLRVHRPRLFELGGWMMLVPPRPPIQADPVAVYGRPDGRRLWDRDDGTMLRAWRTVAEGREALEVPWMRTALEVAEAIPPAYTRYIGDAFMTLRNFQKVSHST